MLVTTVAAIGWVAASKNRSAWHYIALCAFGLSAILAIVTLALIPLIAEKINDVTESIYAVQGEFKLIWTWNRYQRDLQLKAVCWPQHVLFVLGVIAYVAGELWCQTQVCIALPAASGPTRPSCCLT